MCQEVWFLTVLCMVLVLYGGDLASDPGGDVPGNEVPGGVVPGGSVPGRDAGIGTLRSGIGTSGNA